MANDLAGSLNRQRGGSVSHRRQQLAVYSFKLADYSFFDSHRKGLPISSSIAESAVNQVVSQRMAKKRQMRWSDQGAHLLAQVRVHDTNGELKPRAVPLPLRLAKPPHDPEWDAYLLLEAA